MLQLELAHNHRIQIPNPVSGPSQPAELMPHRNDFIVLADIRRIEKAVEAESVRLN